MLRSECPAVRREPASPFGWLQTDGDRHWPQVTVRLQVISQLRSLPPLLRLVFPQVSVRSASPLRVSRQVSSRRSCPGSRPWWTCWAGGAW